MSDFEFPLDEDGDDDDAAELQFEEIDEVVEPGRPALENVVFVVLGATATVAVIYHLATLFG